MDGRSVAAIAALDEGVRAALYAFVRDARRPISREQAAKSVGISRKLAAFHLDKLVAAGLLTARMEAVGAPRVGRRPKVYELSGCDVSVSVPRREPGALAEILIGAVRDERPGERAEEAAVRVARERGVAAGAAERERVRPGRVGPERAVTLVAALLERQGFEPARDGEGLRLRNCPFHPFATAEPELVCGLNHAYIRGLVDGLGVGTAVEALLAPPTGGCCVQLQPCSRSIPTTAADRSTPA